MFEKSPANHKNNRVTERTSVKTEDLKNLQEKARKSVTCVQATLGMVGCSNHGHRQCGPQWRLNFYVGVSNKNFF